MERRRPLRRQDRRLLPHRERPRHRDPTRRQRRGLVRGRRRDERVVHVPGGRRVRRRCADRRERGLHRRLAGAGRHGAAAISRSTRTRSRPTASATTSTTSTPRTHRLGQPGRALALRCRHLVHRRRHRHARRPGWAGGNASRQAMDQLLEVRDFLNEGGKVLYTGKYAGCQYSANTEQFYDPTAADAQCTATRTCSPAVACSGARRRATSPTTCCSTGSAHTSSSTTRARRTRATPRRPRRRHAVHRSRLGFNGADSARTRTTATRSSRRAASCRPAQYPQFESWVAGRGTARAARSSRTPATPTPTRRSPTCRTSG